MGHGAYPGSTSKICPFLFLDVKTCGGMRSPYTIYVYCDDCSDVHPMLLKIHLDDGPGSKEGISRLYQGKSVPEKVAKLARFVVKCPRTGKSFVKKDNTQIFLVPSEDREL
jgi:hypothetical protein